MLALIPQDGMRARRVFLWRCWSSCVSPDCPRRSVYRRVCLTTQSIRPCMHACMCVCVSVSVFEIYSCPSSLHVNENTSKQACIHTHLNARTYTHARTHARTHTKFDDTAVRRFGASADALRRGSDVISDSETASSAGSSRRGSLDGNSDIFGRSFPSRTMQL